MLYINAKVQHYSIKKTHRLAHIANFRNMVKYELVGITSNLPEHIPRATHYSECSRLSHFGGKVNYYSYQDTNINWRQPNAFWTVRRVRYTLSTA